MSGLTAADFELKDSGVRQEIQVASFADVPISLLLALDVSASVEGERLERLTAAAREAVDSLRPGDQAAVLTFRIACSCTPTGRRSRALRTRLRELKAAGLTALYDAVFSAVSLREKAAGRVVVLVFSDGIDTASWLDAAAVIEAARRSDVVITAVSAADALAEQRARGPTGTRTRCTPSAVVRHRSILVPLRLLRGADGTERWATPARLVRRTACTGLSADRGRLQDSIPAHVRAEGSSAGRLHPIDVSLKRMRGDVKARRGYWR